MEVGTQLQALQEEVGVVVINRPTWYQLTTLAIHSSTLARLQMRPPSPLALTSMTCLQQRKGGIGISSQEKSRCVSTVYTKLLHRQAILLLLGNSYIPTREKNRLYL